MSIAACTHAASAGTKPGIELADVIRVHGTAYVRSHRLSLTQLKAVRAIVQCRTAALGGRRDSCPHCGYTRYRYHSCRNRHCPKCQSLAKARWLEDRRQELLPTPYFHDVFTLPHDLNGLVLYSERNRSELLGLLFRASGATLLAFGQNNLGGKPGFTLVLHTWDQQLRPHFHVHALVMAGALSTDGERWIDAGDRFMFPVRALSKVFRGKYVEGVAKLFKQGRLDLPPQFALSDDRRRLVRALRSKAWVVYSKRPFAGPEKLLDYLGRYTHRVGISNDRLSSMKAGQVAFTYRDRRDRDRRKTASLPAGEFIRRFLHHVLPPGFMRIRHYGLLANRTKKESLAKCRQLFGVERLDTDESRTLADWVLLLTGEDISRCPQCGHRPLVSEEIPRLENVQAASPACNDFW